MLRLRLLLLFLLSFNLLVGQSTILVPSEVSTIQEALNLAEEGTNILVSPGTYLGPINWPVTVDGIKLIGIEGYENTILDGQGISRVVSIGGPITDCYNQLITQETTIEGFTIQNGYVNNEEGAGLRASYASPTLRNIMFTNNRAVGDTIEGAGAYLLDYQGSILGCHFVGNSIIGESKAHGIGLYLHVINKVEITNCVFKDNHGSAEKWSYGGGLYAHGGSYCDDLVPNLNMVDCLFEDNSVFSNRLSGGGGAYIRNNLDMKCTISRSTFTENKTTATSDSFIESEAYGGALFVEVREFDMDGCRLDFNLADKGAGLYFESIFFIEEDRGIISNTFFSGNEANQVGGALFLNLDETHFRLDNCVIDNNKGTSIASFTKADLSVLSLNHCTVVDNHGFIQLDQMDFEANNSIFWNNVDQEFLNYANQLSLKNCIVSNLVEGNNLLHIDPQLDEDYIPNIGSPCLNFGHVLSPNLNRDIIGNLRPMPINTKPDIGAYEIDQLSTYALDLFAKQKVQAFPNPATTSIHLNRKIDHIQVYSSKGQLVLSLEGTELINTSRLDAGSYFVEYQNKGEISYGKWMILD